MLGHHAPRRRDPTNASGHGADRTHDFFEPRVTLAREFLIERIGSLDVVRALFRHAGRQSLLDHAAVAPQAVTGHDRERVVHVCPSRPSQFEIPRSARDDVATYVILRREDAEGSQTTMTWHQFN